MRRLVDVMGATVLAVALAIGVAASPAPASDPAVPSAGHYLTAAVVTGLGRAVVIETPDSTVDGPRTWLIDLGSGSWTLAGPGPAAASELGAAVYLPTLRRVYLVPRWSDSVWSFDLRTRQWRQPPVPRVHPDGTSDVVADPKRGSILAWSDHDDSLWIYSPAENTWTAVRPRPPWPTTRMPDGTHGYSLLAYDSGADRALLAILPIPGRAGQTWLLDPETGRWTRAASTPPPMMLGYGELGQEVVYDAVHRRTVLMARGAVALYDSARDRWTIPSSAGWPGLFFGPQIGVDMGDGADPMPKGLPLGALARTDHQLAFDDLHGRVVLMGGSALFRSVGATDVWDVEWRPVSDLWAYDVGLNTWTRIAGRSVLGLLEPVDQAQAGDVEGLVAEQQVR